MPTYDYQCSNGHRFEKFYKSISEGEKKDLVYCAECKTIARRVPSVPLQAHLYGNPDGYHKASPTKRFCTKTVSQIEGNDSSCG